MEINELGKRAYECAVKRGKVHEGDPLIVQHEESRITLYEEFVEFSRADEYAPSEHLPEYSQAIEELADIAIASMTELHRRGANIEEVLYKKMKYNENR